MARRPAAARNASAAVSGGNAGNGGNNRGKPPVPGVATTGNAGGNGGNAPRRTPRAKPEPAEPVARYVAFAPPHLTAPGPEVDAWFRKHLPRGVTRAETVALLDVAAERLNRAYARTLAAIAAARLPVSQARHLTHSLVRDGERARAWKAAGCPDPAAKARAADSAFLEKLESVRNAALRLAQHFEEPDAPIAFALAAAALRAKDQGARLVTLDTDMAATLARFLRVYAETVETHHAAKRGPFLHRAVLAPFIFGGSIDRRTARGDGLERGLLWRAVEKARRITGQLGPSQMGAPMPEEGRALWGVAVALLRDVTGKELSESAAQRRLSLFMERNPGVGFHEWPAPDANI